MQISQTRHIKLKAGTLLGDLVEAVPEGQCHPKSSTEPSCIRRTEVRPEPDPILEYLQDLQGWASQELDPKKHDEKELASLLAEFADVFAKDDLDVGHFISVIHSIDTGNARPMPHNITKPIKGGVQHGECPVCQQLVPALRTHANTCHLPWFIELATACGIRRRQYGRVCQLKWHAQGHHPGESCLVDSERWEVWMNALFRTLARAIGVHGYHNSPCYARGRGLRMAQVPVLRPEENQYLMESWVAGEPGFNPCQPQGLRDLAYWKVTLQLIAKAPPGTVDHLVHATNLEDGQVFLGGLCHP